MFPKFHKEREMKGSKLFRFLAVLIAVSILLTACGGKSATPAATQAATLVPATEAASTFVCPEPNPKMEVTSKELNIFVWTEYIPQDILDCFEKVYGVKVNRDEYSSNEEMYAKL